MAKERVSWIRNGLAAGIASVLLAACGEDSADTPVASATGSTPTAPSPPPPPGASGQNTQGPWFPDGDNRVSGEVLLVGQGPEAAAGAWVNIWVQLRTGSGYSYVWAHNGAYVVADERGQWSSWSDLPDSELTILTTHAGQQPCAAIVDSRSRDPVRLEVIPDIAFDTVEPPRPSNARDPSLTGTVYEMTSEGRKPVSGAKVWVEHGFEIQTARALTGREGRYYVCGLPPEIALSVTKSGYVMATVYPIDTSRSPTLDIELRREGS